MRRWLKWRRQRWSIGLLAVLGLLATGCGSSDPYTHDVGHCSRTNGKYQVIIYVYRATGADDIKAARQYANICANAKLELSK